MKLYEAISSYPGLGDVRAFFASEEAARNWFTESIARNSAPAVIKVYVLSPSGEYVREMPLIVIRHKLEPISLGK